MENLISILEIALYPFCLVLGYFIGKWKARKIYMEMYEIEGSLRDLKK